MSNMERERLRGFVISLDGLIEQRNTARQFKMLTSRRGLTGVQISLMATRYSDILSASLVPFLKGKYPHGHRLYQDNDPKHTSKYVYHFCGKQNAVVEESS